MSNDAIFLNNLDGLSSSNTIAFFTLLDGGTSASNEFAGTVSGNGSSEKIKERISSLVARQFPEFISTEYELFITFVQYYYKFLELDYGAHEVIQNARSYSDIDSTVPSFVALFLDQYAKAFPKSSLVDKTLLVKKIKDLYEAKGSELSFRLLFQLLYDTSVSVNYPYENVLIASGGKWNQKTTLKIERITGSVSSVNNRFLTYTFNNVEYETPILDVRSLTTNLYEFTLQTDKIAPTYVKNNIVYVFDRDRKVVFSGYVRTNPVSFGIAQAGSGFKIGQIFTVNYGGGVGTLIKITSVNSTGGITGARIINYGYGYPTNFTAYLSATSAVSQIGDFIISSTRGSSESVSLVKSGSGIADYFAEDYTDDILYTGLLITSYNESSISSLLQNVPEDPTRASLIFAEGTIARYPGFYETNQSFLSEAEIRLEDDLLYQPFAYQTSTEIDITKFYDVIIDLIHPAGQRLFNNRVLQNQIDVSANVATSNVFPDVIKFEAYDSADIGELLSLETLFRYNDISSTESNSVFQFNSTKQDSIEELSDNNFFNLTIEFSDNVDTFDELGVQQNVLADSVSEQDSITSININKGIDDQTEGAEDSGSVLVQDYTESYNVYFIDDYIGSKISF